jgi:hypothetical protein
MSNAVRISDSCEGVKPVVAAALLDLRRFEGGYISTDIQLGHKYHRQDVVKALSCNFWIDGGSI